MRITTDLLKQYKACSNQVNLFTKLYPTGVELTTDAAIEAHESGLNVLWLLRILPSEGPGSRRDLALRCAMRVQHLCTDERVDRCLAVVKRRVVDPGSVSDDELSRAAGDASGAAWSARAAAGDAATAARDAAWDPAGAAWSARDAAGNAAGAPGWAAAGAAWDAWTAKSAAGAARAARAAAREAEHRWQIGQLVQILQRLEGWN